MPFFGTTPFAAPGLGTIASIIMLGFGLWWLARAEASARKKGEGYGADADVAVDASKNQIVRERATTSSTFDPAEVRRGIKAMPLRPSPWQLYRLSSWLASISQYRCLYCPASTLLILLIWFGALRRYPLLRACGRLSRHLRLLCRQMFRTSTFVRRWGTNENPVNWWHYSCDDA